MICSRGRNVNAIRAFTLTHVMVSASIFILLIAGVLSSHLFGLKMFQITETKLVAGSARTKVMNSLASDLQAAKILKIGSGSSTSFVQTAAVAAQVGSAVEIYKTTNTSSYIRYYLDTNTHTFNRISSGQTNATALVNYVTTDTIFQCLNYSGSLLSNRQSICVVDIRIPIYQLQAPLVSFAAGKYFEKCEYKSRVAVRSTD